MDYDMSILIAHQQQQQQQLQEAQAEAMEEVMGDALNAKQKNTLPLYGNKETMNINPMILSNIQGSAYFKEELYKMKTFHEVIDEIFYKVEHLEPWEKGSRKLAGQVGMCGGVRGVAAGGIVSSAYCLLYKLFTLKLTRRQVQAMLDHVDSPYIRALGFMYIRYCQPPVDFWDWFEPYLDDPEEIDLKAGGGFKITVGAMCRMMLLKLDWFGTMLPRVSVSVSKTLEQNVKAASQPDRPMPGERERENGGEEDKEPVEREGGREAWGEAARRARPERKERSSPPRRRSRSRSRERNRHERRRSRSRDRGRSHSRERRRSPQRRRSRERSKERPRRSGSHDRRAKSRSRSRERSGRRRSRSRERRRSSRSRSRDRKKKSRSSSRDQRRR